MLKESNIDFKLFTITADNIFNNMRIAFFLKKKLYKYRIK